MKLKLLYPDAQVPRYATPGASGLDIHAYSSDGTGWVIGPGSRVLISTGIAIELPMGHEAQVRPRSGMALRHGVAAVLGTIDSDYRGEIKVLLVNHSRDAAPIQHGDRIAQLVVAPVASVTVEVVEDLSETARGEKGFGSSGR